VIRSVFVPALFVLVSPLAVAQVAAFRNLHVEKEPGERTGPAVISVNGKPKRLVQRALDAWPVMNGQNALVLVLHTRKNAPEEYHLRFYEGASRKYRDLGAIVFQSATFTEHELSDGS
jgi:hypothetical protein